MSVQHDQPVHVCDIEMGAAIQPFEGSTPSVPITGNEPVTNTLLHEKIMKSEINNGNETVNIPLPVMM